MLESRNLFIVYTTDYQYFLTNYSQHKFGNLLNQFYWLGNLQEKDKDLVYQHTNFTHSKQLLGLNINFLIVNLINCLDIESLARAVNSVANPGIIVFLLHPQQQLQLDSNSQFWHRYSIKTPNYYDFFNNLLNIVDIKPITLLSKTIQIIKEKLASSKNNKETAIQLNLQQQQIITSLTKQLKQHSLNALIYSKRGCGKTTLLEQLSQQLLNHPLLKSLQLVISAPAKRSTFNVEKYHQLKFIAPDKLLKMEPHFFNQTIILLDEAAQLSVNIINQLLHKKSYALILATTIESYEGSCMGFVYKFLAYNPNIQLYKLTINHRWSNHDPIEEFTNCITAAIDDPIQTLSQKTIKNSYNKHQLTAHLTNDNVNHIIQVYRLFCQTHYKTRPNDLRRLFDADNSFIYYLTIDQHKVIGALWYLLEFSEYSKEDKESIINKQRRPKGNILLQKLAMILQSSDILDMSCLRISRISVDKNYRKQGISQLLMDLPNPSQLQKNNYNVDFIGVIYNQHPKLESFWSGFGLTPIYNGRKIPSFADNINTIAIKGISERWFTKIQPLIDQLLKTNNH